MKDKFRLYLVGAYDLILSVGAIATGIMMIRSDYGIFKDYPEEWLSRLPFHSWVWPGVIIMILFGFGNIISAITAFQKKMSLAGIMSIGMGGILLFCIALQRGVLGEWYMPDNYFLIFGTVQLLLGRSLCFGSKRNKKPIFIKDLGGSKNE